MGHHLSCRIRLRYYEAIVTGEKTVEYRPDTDYWRVRLRNLELTGDSTIVFLCGPRIHRREIVGWAEIRTPDTFSDQGKRDVPTEYCFAIFLGDEVES